MTVPKTAATPGPTVTMQCMEVWGGNAASDNGVIMPGLDAWVYSRPYEGDDAGGDIHYVSSCATGRITRILVADVSGHGQQVAQVALSLRALMRRYVNYIDQTRLMEGLNVAFSSLSDSGRFATAVVASYFAPTDQFVISNAGHPRPYRFDARKRTWEVLKDTNDARAEGLANIPLGIAEPTRYDQIAFRLQRNDLVLIYTDSVLEARGPDGRQLGEAGLLKILNSLDASAPERLIAAFLAAVEIYGGGPPRDDITVLLIRPNALKPSMSMLMGIKAAFRIAAASLEDLWRGARGLPLPQLTIPSILGAIFRRANGSGAGTAGAEPPAE